MGLVSLGWMWLGWLAAASARADRDGGGNAAFHEAKLVTARFYATRELPGSSALRRKIEAGAENVMKIPRRPFSGPRQSTSVGSPGS